MAEVQARPTADSPPHLILLLSFGKYACSHLTRDNSHQVRAKWCKSTQKTLCSLFYPEKHTTVWVEKRKAKQLSRVISSQGLPMGTLMRVCRKAGSRLQTGWDKLLQDQEHSHSMPPLLLWQQNSFENTDLTFFISKDSKLTFSNQTEAPPKEEKATTNQRQTATQTQYVHSCSPPSLSLFPSRVLLNQYARNAPQKASFLLDGCEYLWQ